MIGTRLGPWIIDREVGRGGMGCVYLARRDAAAEGEPREAAIKVLAAELALDSGFLQRFQREIEIVRHLDHPHVVRFLESGTQNGRYYYAMEYVPGPSLEALRERRSRLPWQEVLDLALQIAPALKHAHDRGVIHRDLKPSNLLCVSPDAGGAEGLGPVKLTDFGIASLFASPHLTVTGGIVGTAEYLSPEQAAGKPVTQRSDLYSFGVVLYTLLTGRPPFEGDVLDLLHKHRFAQCERPSRLVPEAPPELDEIICQLLEKDPGRRLADGAVLYRRLDGLRRRLEFRARQQLAETSAGAAHGATSVYVNREGPATLMSRLMRQELDRQNQGGPVRRFLNRPWVLVTLFLATVGLLVWSLWPASPETLFRRGAALMASEDPGDWDTAWDQYLGPLEQKYPNHPHREELDEFRRRRAASHAERQAAQAARRAGPMSEAQWFYQEGLRLRQQGDEARARQVWRALAEAFGDVPSEGPWVRLARRELEKKEAQADAVRQWEPVREAVRRAWQLRQEGRAEEADRALRALRELYRDDPAAQALLKEQ